MFKKISGWGNSLHSFSLTKVLNKDDLLLQETNSRGVIARGLGRSYGDSANNSGGTVLDTGEFSQFKIDSENGIAVVGAGVSIHTLETESLKRGFFPFVVPGTGYVTIGGAIASDIHGKSHHRVGSFSNHLLEIKLLIGNGSLRALRPDDDTAPLFWATVGGMGLTGMIVEAKIRLMKVETAFVSVKEKRVASLDELLKVLLDFNSNYPYTVAWIDLSGRFKGRGIVSAAEHTMLDRVPHKKRCKPLEPLEQKSFVIPVTPKNGIVNGLFIRAFNTLWFHKPLGKGVQHLQKYMHPLDTILNWNELYGVKGFVQYQFVIPIERVSVLKTILMRLKSENHGSFLTVLKSFGNAPTGLIGFPMNGWTLAIDLPNGTRHLSRLLRDLDELVLGAGGRVYLSKDSRLNHKHLSSMYPHLGDWKRIKKEIDPQNNWQSDQGRRLKLC